MNDSDAGQDSEPDIVQQKVRRAAGINALRKVGLIVASEQQADNDKARVLRWLGRFGWIMLPGVVLLVAYLIGKI